MGLGICLLSEAGDLWLFISRRLAEGSNWFWREASLASACSGHSFLSQTLLSTVDVRRVIARWEIT